MSHSSIDAMCTSWRKYPASLNTSWASMIASSMKSPIFFSPITAFTSTASALAANHAPFISHS